MNSNFSLTSLIPPSLTVKEAKKQRKADKLIKQLDKQIEQEAEDRAELEKSHNKTGSYHHFMVMYCCLPV